LKWCAFTKSGGPFAPIHESRGTAWIGPTACRGHARIAGREATIDGEAVVCDAQGVTDFDALRAALARRQGGRGVFLFAFDLLEVDGRDLRRDAWENRREALAAAPHGAAAGIRLSEQPDSGDGAAMFRHACTTGLDGIVSKRCDAPYRSGRCADWIKIKNPEAPAVRRIEEATW
jgi:bifunctional non-homologous end joining protein LigD